MKTITLIGYSGYACVAYDCFFSQGQIVTAYTALEENGKNPFGLRYLGHELNAQVQTELRQYDYFVTIADNAQRRQTTEVLVPLLGQPVIALHKTAVLSRNLQSGEGVMIGPRVIVNPGAVLGPGVVLQSGCIVDYEARVMDFACVGAGAVIGAGAVVGEEVFIGAGAVIAPGIKIGMGCKVPEGAVVSRDLEDNNILLG